MRANLCTPLEHYYSHYISYQGEPSADRVATTLIDWATEKASS